MFYHVKFECDVMIDATDELNAHDKIGDIFDVCTSECVTRRIRFLSDFKTREITEEEYYKPLGS